MSLNKNEIYIIYHVALMGCWKDVLKYQLKELESSQLLMNSNKVFITAVGKKEHISILKIFINSMNLRFKFNIEHCGDLDLYEFPGIGKVQEIAKKYPLSRILYIHSKGASYCTQNFTSQQLKNRSQSMKFLTYSVITKWRECYNFLDYYDTCGPDVFQNIYAGNFWWANADYVNKIIFEHKPPFDPVDRGKCEFFIGIANPKTKEILSSTKNNNILKYFTIDEINSMKTSGMGMFDARNLYQFEAFYRDESIFAIKYLAYRIKNNEKIQESWNIIEEYIKNGFISRKEFDKMLITDI